MKIIYLGTPDFAVKPLQSLIDNGFNVIAVISQPDKPVGRKQIITPTPVKLCAEKNDIPVYQFDKINKNAQTIRELSPDIMVTCAYGQLISQEVIDIAPKGIYNIHASLLPKYRGASPIQSAILNGETVTGVTIMKTEIGMDSGDILATKQIDVLPTETAGELFERLSDVGAELIVKALTDVKNNTFTLTKQNHEQATFCKMIKKEEALIDWTNQAQTILNKIRAYNPSPIAFTKFNNKIFKIYNAEICSLKGEAGCVLKADKKQGLVIACKDKSLKLTVVQMEGGKKMDASQFVLGNKILVGDKASI